MRLMKSLGLLLTAILLVSMVGPANIVLAVATTTVEVNSGQTITLAPAGSQSNIPLDIKNIPNLGAGNGVGGFTFDLSWNPNVIHVDTVTPATIAGFTIMPGTPNNTTGTVGITAFTLGTVYLTGSVTVATLGINAVGSAGNTTSIAVAITSLGDNGGNPIAATPVNAPVLIAGLEVTTNTATGITTNSATLNGNLTSLGTYTSASVSFEWGTTQGGPYPNPTTPQTIQATTTLPAAFTAPISGLSSNTTYYFKAKATAGSVSANGTELSFITAKVSPTVTTSAASSITYNSATLNGNLTSLGDYTIVQVSFEWGTTQGGPYPNTIPYPAMTSTGVFSVPLSGLASNTPHYFRAKATADGITVYGSEATFTTAKTPPTVTTNAASDITTTSATLNGNLTSRGDYTTVNVSFVWGQTQGTYPNSTTPVPMTTTGALSAPISGLTIDTTYYFKAKATADGVTVYGSEISVTTVRLVSIDISPDNPEIPKGRTQQFNATGTYSDSSTGNVTGIVTWTSSAPSVATIGATGLARGVAVGTTTIYATSGNISSDNATLSVLPPVLERIAVTPANVSVPLGRTQPFTATGTYSDNSMPNITANVTWTSSNPAKATIIANTGLATTVAVGSTIITASKDGITSNEAILTVTGAVLNSITVTPDNAEISLGRTKQFTAVGTYSNNATANLTNLVSWTSSNGLVATIGAHTGLARSLAIGQTTITATLGEKSDNATLTVTGAELDSLVITPDNPSISANRTLQFTATAYYSYGLPIDVTDNCTWGSSANTTATITAGGLATGLLVGTTNITATYDGKTDTTVLTVIAPSLESVTIDDVYPASDNVVAPMAVGSSLQLYLTGTLSDGSSVNLTNDAIWHSRDRSVATISRTGLVTGVSIGAANITAKYRGLEDWVILTVTQPPTVAASGATSITDNSSTLNGILVSLGSASSANVSFEWGLTTDYGNSTTPQTMASPGAFSAALSGLTPDTPYHFRAKAVGTGTSYSPDQTFTTSTTPPTVVTNDASNVTSSSATLNGYLSNKGSASTAYVAFEWGLTTAYGNNTTSQEMTTAGNFTAELSGLLLPSTTYHFRAQAVGDGVSYGADKTFTTSTALTSIAVTPANPSVAAGRTRQFTATGTYSNGSTANITASANWTSSDESKATITAGGLATGLAAGTTTITATLSGVSGNTTLTVTAPALVSITIDPSSASVAAGVQRQFTASGNYSAGPPANITATVTWSSSNTGVASISATGLATSHNEGTAIITATKSGISQTATLTVTAPVLLDSIVVTPVNPTIVHPGTRQFRAMGTYSNGSRVEITTTANWTSSDESKATIGLHTGLAVSVGAGQTTITATEPVSGFSGNTTLTVTAATLDSIAVTPTPPPASVAAGQSKQFTATGNFSGTLADLTNLVSWSSSNNNTARVNAAGLATSYAPGTANITTTSGNVSGITTLTVGQAELESVTVTPVSPTITFVAGNPPTLQFTATASYSDGRTEPVTTTANWTSSAQGVATIGLNTGLATTLDPGATPLTTTITATYTAGNVTKSPNTILTVLPDTVAPVVTLSSPTEGQILSDRNLTVSGSIDDVAATANVTVNGVASTLTLVNGNFSQGVLLKNGSNTVLVNAVDRSGNTGTSGTITVRVDPRRPKVTVTSPAGGTLTNQAALTITGVVTGAGLSANLTFNGASQPLTLTPPVGSFTANVTLVEGVNIIVVNAWAAGTPQFLGTSGVITITLDTIAPVVTINSPMSESVVSLPMSQVSGTVNDPYVTTAQLILNQGAPQSIPVVGGNFTQNITLVPGSDNITVVATDGAGNSSTATLVRLTLDITRPGVTITTPANNLVTNIAGQTVTGTVSDPTITTATLYLNGTAQTPPISVAPDGSFNKMVTLTTGVVNTLNTLEVMASDNATPPNTGSSGVVNVTVDTTPPVITLGLSDPTDSITITVTAPPDEVLVAIPTVSVNQTAILMTQIDVNKWSGTFGSTGSPIASGEYIVTATGTDRAGNLSTVTATFSKQEIYVDGIIPTTVTTATGGTTTLDIETYGYVTGDISVTEHLFNPSGNVGNPQGAPTAGVFVEIVASSELVENLKQIYIRVDYDPNDLPAGTDESTLKLYLWDVATGTWQPVLDSGSVPEEDYIYGTVDHLSKYGSFGRLTTPVTPPPTIGGGGGGGGGALTKVAISGLTSTTTLNVDESGLAQAAYQLTTLDQKVSLDIAKGTKLLDAQGKALGSLLAATVTSPPAPPAQRAIVLAYDFGPDGTTFEPAITMTMSYDPASLPKDASEGELYVTYWDGSKWVALESTVNTEANTVSAKISHLTQFALMGKLPPAPPVVTLAPAKFTVSDFSLTPREAKPAEPVTVSVLVANTGGQEGKYTVVLKIDGVEEASKEVTINAGASQTVRFSIVKSLARTYKVNVNGLTGSFVVKEEAIIVTEKLPEVVTEVGPGPNWGLIGGIIAAVVVIIGLLVYFVWRRRGSPTPS